MGDTVVNLAVVAVVLAATVLNFVKKRVTIKRARESLLWTVVGGLAALQPFLFLALILGSLMFGFFSERKRSGGSGKYILPILGMISGECLYFSIEYYIQGDLSQSSGFLMAGVTLLCVTLVLIPDAVQGGGAHKE